MNTIATNDSIASMSLPLDGRMDVNTHGLFSSGGSSDKTTAPAVGGNGQRSQKEDDAIWSSQFDVLKTGDHTKTSPDK
jgi:hypothetical protein